MNFLRTSMLFLSSLLLMGALKAQELPQPSPKASVMQRVGLTDITVDYSSPGVKGRKIFGGLVPYDKMWRTGANKATQVEFSKDVTIEGNDLPAGQYSFFTIPGKEKWTLIFNKNTELWGTGGYEKGEDALRIEVEPEKVSQRERMTFFVSDFDMSSARVDLEWAKTRVSFNVEVATDEQAMANIEQELGGVPGKFANAARHTLRVGKNQDKGLEWVNTAISMEDNWYYYWIKAELLHEQGSKDKAYKAMKKSKELGDKSERFFYKDKVEKALKEWK